MAIAFVNGARGGDTASSASIVTSTNSLTAGNLIVCAFYIDDVTKTPSGVPTDTATNTYRQAGTTQAIGGGGGNIVIYYNWNCLGNASNIITLGLSGSSGSRAYSLWQFSGVPTSDPIIGGTAFGSGNSGTAVNCTTAVSHGQGSSVIIAYGVAFTGGGVGFNAGGGGYTFNKYAITGATINQWADEYLIGSADSTPTMTVNAGGSFAWGIMGASFGTRNSGGLSLRGVG